MDILGTLRRKFKLSNPTILPAVVCSCFLFAKPFPSLEPTSKKFGTGKWSSQNSFVEYISLVWWRKKGEFSDSPNQSLKPYLLLYTA